MLPSKSQFYLGVDGGGTKTKAVLIDENKKIIGRGLAAGSNATIFGIDESVNQVYIAIKQAVADKKLKITHCCLALAGVNTYGDNRHWEQAIKNHPSLSQLLFKKTRIVNDTLAALRSGTTDKNTVVIIAGTGSNCYGRNKEGKEAKSGGEGYILSDEGSGYDIGLSILKKVTQTLDGREGKTTLTDLLFDKLKISSLEDLYSLIYTKPWNKTDIAKIAPLAEIAAKKGDKIAKTIIQKAAGDLGIMIKAVVQKLHLENKCYTIVTSGSVFKIQNILGEQLKKDIIRFSPHAKFTKPKIDSSLAAAYLALEENI